MFKKKLKPDYLNPDKELNNKLARMSIEQSPMSLHEFMNKDEGFANLSKKSNFFELFEALAPQEDLNDTDKIVATDKGNGSYYTHTGLSKYLKFTECSSMGDYIAAITACNVGFRIIVNYAKELGRFEGDAKFCSVFRAEVEKQALFVVPNGMKQNNGNDEVIVVGENDIVNGKFALIFIHPALKVNEAFQRKYANNVVNCFIVLQ